MGMFDDLPDASQAAPQAAQPGQERRGRFDDLPDAKPIQSAAPQPKPIDVPSVSGQRQPEALAGESGIPQTVNTAGKRDLGETADTSSELYGGMGNPYSPFIQGASLGSSDEITSALMTPFEMAANAATGKGPVDPREAYAQQSAEFARNKALYEQEHPIAATASELAGGLMIGGPGAKFIQAAPSLLGKTVRSGAVSGAIGGAQGFMGTDGSLADRAKGAGTGAAVGAVLGSILPPIFATSHALMKGMTTPIRSLAKPEQFAANKVAEAAARDKISPQRLADRLSVNSNLKPDVAIADVGGKNMNSLLRAASNVPSEARSGLVQQLEYRQAKQLNRLQDDIAGAMGDHTKFFQTTEQLVASRKAAAKPLFDTAFKTPTPYTFKLENVLNRPLTRQLVERARVAAANRGERFQNILLKVGKNGKVTKHRVIDTEGLHRVKMIIDETMNGLKRGQETGLKNVSMRDLSILKSDLVKAIDNPPYKAALNKYAGDSALVNAIDDGFENFLKMDPQEIRSTLGNLSPSEARLWRIGAARSVADKLRDVGRTGTNRADILSSPKFMTRLEAAIPDTQSRRLLLQKVRLENRMARTRNAVQGNSSTASQLAEGQEAAADAETAQNIVRAAKGVASGNILEAAVSFIGRAKNTATGLRPEVADQIIRLLTARDPAKIMRAKALIDRQADRIANQRARRDLYNGLRAVSTGLLSGQLADHLATP